MNQGQGAEGNDDLVGAGVGEGTAVGGLLGVARQWSIESIQQHVTQKQSERDHLGTPQEDRTERQPRQQRQQRQMIGADPQPGEHSKQWTQQAAAEFLRALHESALPFGIAGDFGFGVVRHHVSPSISSWTFFHARHRRSLKAFRIEAHFSDGRPSVVEANPAVLEI